MTKDSEILSFLGNVVIFGILIYAAKLMADKYKKVPSSEKIVTNNTVFGVRG